MRREKSWALRWALSARLEPIDPVSCLTRSERVRALFLASVIFFPALACTPAEHATATRIAAAPQTEAAAPAVDIAEARAASAPQLFTWAPFSKETFARARAEHRFILLHGAAVWCHWCHVMESITYRDPEVGRLLRDRFIAIRVDIDSRPDIAERYGDWGWPATILFSPDAQEIGKFRGYLPPAELAAALENVSALHLDAPALDAEPGAASAPVEALPWLFRRAELDLDGYYDDQQGGWGMRQKAPLGADAEFELLRGAAGEPQASARAQFTLNRQAALLDPVWGGIYQYSVDGDWRSPHFEKLLPFQAANLESYALAFALSKEPAYRADAESIAGYVARFLTGPDGTFYVSQDADVGAHDEHVAFVDGHRYYASNERTRLAFGLPDVDRHVYAAENGLMIAALCRLFEATHDPATVVSARRAADAILASHLEVRGTVLHDAKSSDKVHFLADGAAFGRALVRLYSVTREVKYLSAARRIAGALEPLFDGGVGAYFAHDPDPDAAGVFAARRHPFEDNVRMARFLSALSEATDDASYRTRSRSLLAAISTPAALDTQGRLLGEYLLALREVELVSLKKNDAADPLHEQSPLAH
jgi:uncharacterized protein YyaL (SSP411 family)